MTPLSTQRELGEHEGNVRLVTRRCDCVRAGGGGEGGEERKSHPALLQAGRYRAYLPVCLWTRVITSKSVDQQSILMMKLPILVLEKKKKKEIFFENTSVPMTTRHGSLVYMGQEENQCVVVAGELQEV